MKKSSFILFYEVVRKEKIEVCRGFMQNLMCHSV